MSGAQRQRKFGTTQQHRGIGGALGATIAASDVAAGAATLLPYNSDTFFIGAATGNAVNTTFGEGETVFSLLVQLA